MTRHPSTRADRLARTSARAAARAADPSTPRRGFPAGARRVLTPEEDAERAALLAAGLTVTEIARRCGVGRWAIVKWMQRRGLSS